MTDEAATLTPDDRQPPRRQPPVPGDHPGHGYALFESLVSSRVASIAGPVFATDADPGALWKLYLSALPEHRQHYACSACRRFVQAYGGLALIDPADGTHFAAAWPHHDDCPKFFRLAAQLLTDLVCSSRVTGVFLWGEKANERHWGLASTGPWSHLHGTPAARPYANALLTPSQKAAELRQDYQILRRSLAEFPHDVAAQALRVLVQVDLFRSEKSQAVAEWFLSLHNRLHGVRNDRTRENLVWLAVAGAPPGFCHVRTTVLGTLLEDLKAGVPFEQVSRRWSQKLHPLQYQRPTAAPSAGQVREAEKLVETLGIAKSLGRRFARLTDVLAFVWRPNLVPPCSQGSPAPGTSGGGVFSHLLTAGKVRAPGMDLPNAPMTWEKFSRTVLPHALSLEALCPRDGAYYGLLTAADPDAPPILQWDGLQGHPRNPASWYFYSQGSTASRWGLAAGQWAAVNAVFLSPQAWQDPQKFSHQGEHVFFALEGCRDCSVGRTGLYLFPEILKGELREARRVIEAHSEKGAVTGAESADANGLAFARSSPKPLTLRVRTPGGLATYTLDRWD